MWDGSIVGVDFKVNDAKLDQFFHELNKFYEATVGEMDCLMKHIF